MVFYTNHNEINLIINTFHFNHVWHLGMNATIIHIQHFGFYWNNLKNDIKYEIKNCLECQIFIPIYETKKIETKHAKELVEADCIELQDIIKQ